MQLSIVGKSRMAPRSANRKAKNIRGQILEFRKHLVVESHLVPAYWTPIGRIKSEHHRPSAEFAEFDRLIGSASEREIGGGRAGRQSCGSIGAGSGGNTLCRVHKCSSA